MVKETRQVFDVEDLKALRLKCKKCGAELVLEVSQCVVPVSCPAPNCGERWTPVNSNSSRAGGVVYALRQLLEFPEGGMTIRFEIEGEPEQGR